MFECLAEFSGTYRLCCGSITDYLYFQELVRALFIHSPFQVFLSALCRFLGYVLSGLVEVSIQDNSGTVS